MDKARSNRIKEIFSEAAELPPPDRSVYLDQACAGDSGLRSEIERLLTAHASSGGALDEETVGQYLALDPGRTHTLEPGEHVGRFRVTRRLGRGGVGEVYEVEDTAFGGAFALKVLRPEHLREKEFANRFLREIRLARRVTHPNVCRVFEVGQHTAGGVPAAFLTMELLAGETLAKRLERGPMTPAEALPVIRQMAAGLGALHQAGVVHRDFKPANAILVPANDGLRVVITDFGLAHAPSGDTSHELQTSAGVLLGTPAYMAPEQLAGKKAGPSADIYSLGIVMYEMLRGKRPYPATTFGESASEKLAGPPEPLGRHVRIGQAWEDLVARCLERDPALRPSSGPELTRALEALPVTGGPSHSGRAWVAAIAAAVTLTGMLAAMAVPAWRDPAMRRLCREFPGSATFCVLPSDRRFTLRPFTAAPDDPLARGAARFLREAAERLTPEPGARCIQISGDDRPSGVGLVVEGSVASTAPGLEVTVVVREPKPRDTAAPLVLRRETIRVAPDATLDLYSAPVERIHALMDMSVDARELAAWKRLAPKRAAGFRSYLTALGHIDAGRHGEAVRLLEDAVSITQEFGFAPAHTALAVAHAPARGGPGDEARESRARLEFRRAAQLDAEFGFARAQRHWGEFEADRGNVAAAIEHLAASLRQWPHDLSARRSLSAAHESANDPASAREVLAEAVTRTPACWMPRTYLAEFHSRHGYLQEAEKELLTIRGQDADNPYPYHNLAFDYLRVGRLDEAIDMASKYVAARGSALAYSTLGRALVTRGCAAAGFRNLQRAVEVDPSNHYTAANLASAYHALRPDDAGARGAYEAAARTAREAVRRLPGDAYARAVVALNTIRLGQVREGLALARETAPRAPGDTRAALVLAEAFDAAGERLSAIAALETAFRNRLPRFEADTTPGLAALRQDPAYASLMAKYGLQAPAVRPDESKVCPGDSSVGAGLRSRE